MDQMSYVMQQLLTGVSVGGQYALIAIGYTMVYGILRLINFAHGDIFMMAGFFMVYLSATMPIYISIPAVLLLTVILPVGGMLFLPQGGGGHSGADHLHQLSGGGDGPVLSPADDGLGDPGSVPLLAEFK